MVEVRALFSRTIRCMLEYILSWVFFSRTILCIFEYFDSWVLLPLEESLKEFFYFEEGLPVNYFGIFGWKGDAIFKDMRLGVEAMNSQNLPVKIKDAFIRTMKVQVRRERQEPIIHLIDYLVLVTEPAPDGHPLKVEDIEELYDSKLKSMVPTEGFVIGRLFRGIIWKSPKYFSQYAYLL